MLDFFDGKATMLQRKMIEEWLTEHPENRQLFYQYLDEWESRNPQFVPDDQTALKKFRKLIALKPAAGEPVRELPLRRLKNSMSRLIMAGIAGVTGLLMIAVWVYRDEIRYQSVRSGPGQTIAYRLPDGTGVVLNANSCLKIPRFGFGEESREVQLEGEAEFEVATTADSSRFVVKMGAEYEIEVLGTQFIALSRHDRKQVFLSKGSVKLRLPEGKQLYMKPGNLFKTSDLEEASVVIPDQVEQFSGWKHQLFYFDNTPLSEVARQLEDRFGVRIVIADTTLANRKMGGIYKAKQLDDLLQVLAEMFDAIVIEHNEQQVELRMLKKI